MRLQERYDTIYSNYQNAKAVKDDWAHLLKYTDSLLNIYPKKAFISEKKAIILNHLGVSNIYGGNLPKALEQFSQAIRIKKKIGKYHEAGRDYYLMGITWSRHKEFSKSKKYYDSAYAITQKNIKNGKPVLEFKATLLNIYGCHYANVDSLDLAESYFKKAIKYADSLSFKNQVAMNSMQYAEVILDKKRYKEALNLNQRALAIFEETNDTLGKINLLFPLAECYYEMGNYKEALKLLQQSIDYHKAKNEDGELLLEYTLYVNTLAKNNNYKEAFQAQKVLQGLVDSLRNASEYKKMADIEANLKYENIKSIDSLNVVNDFKIKKVTIAKKANTRFWMVVISLLVILGLIGFFFIRNRQKVKEQAYQNILLNNKVATKAEEINELLTETIQHIKSKERIAENLQKLATEQEGISLKSIIADLKASKADNAKLMLIKQNIEQVNFEFIKKLKTQHPDLTKTDIEICSFIRIGLSRKEIANLRNTSIEAIKSSRFRIKKKLNLDSDTSLDNYINTL